MSEQINRVELLKRLVMAKPAVFTQTYIPILSHFMFDGDSVTAYNDITAITIPCDVGDFQGCLPAELLIKTLNSMTTESVSMLRHDGYVLITSGKSKIKIPVLQSADFPFSFARINQKIVASFQLNKERLKGLQKCLINVGTDSAHPAAMGVTLDPFYSETQAAFYSTDNVTLSRFVFETDDEQHDPLIMPTFFCNQLVSLANGSDVSVEIRTGSLIAVFADGAMLFTKTIPDLDPMDFPRVINIYLDADNGKTLEIPKGFDQAIERALLVQTSENFKTTSATVEGNKLLLESISKFGEVRDELVYEGEDVKFRIDPSRIKRILQVTNRMALLPNVMLLTDDNQDFIHLIAHCSY